MTDTKLTTAEIIHYAENDLVHPEWAWESVLESAMNYGGAADAADGARFLEHLHPDRTWSPSQYHGLMYHHFTGRWESAAFVGYVRAGELLGDKVISEKQHLKITFSDVAVGQWLRDSGTHVFDCADGTVLTFDGIVNGVITEEDPA